MFTFRTTSPTCLRRHELRVVKCHSSCPGCAAMTVRRASVTTLTARYKPLRLAHKSRCSHSHTWANGSGWKSHTLIQKARSHSRAQTRTPARFAITTTHMLVTGAEANPLRSNWTPNVHRRLSEVCLCCFALFASPATHNRISHALTRIRTHTHNTLSPAGSEEEQGGVEVLLGSYDGTHTHAH